MASTYCQFNQTNYCGPRLFNSNIYGNFQTNMLLILSVLLFSSSIAKILTQYIVSDLKINLFMNSYSARLPSFSPQLGIDKTSDLFNFWIVLVLVGILYGLNLWLTRNRNNRTGMVDVIYVAVALLIFLQTHFVRFSGKEALMVAFLVNLGFIWIKRKGWGIKLPSWVVLANGFLTGFYLTFFIRQFTTSALLIFGVVLLATLLYEILSERGYKFVLSSWHIFLVVAVFMSWNIQALSILGIIELVTIFIIKKEFPFMGKHLSLIYSYVFLFLVAYNPNFYFGNIDTIEEGNWLGWLQRLTSGQVLYRDVAVFHPPLLIWGLNAFTKLFGVSVYEVRLYFHLLEIIGLGIIYLISRKILKSRNNIILSMLLILSLVSNQVRNHVGIRLGMGLLSIYLLLIFHNKNKYVWIFISGVVAFVSVGVSTESGVAAGLACVLGLCISSKNIIEIIKRLSIWGSGFAIPATILISILWFQGGLNNAINQMWFYMKAYSGGFFNIAVPRMGLDNILLWWRVDRYFNSDVIMWEFSILIMGLILVYLIYRFINNKFIRLDRFIFMIFIYCLVISRAVLSRSDWYHLLFLLIPIIPAFAYIIETWQIEYKLKYVLPGLWILLIVVINRELVQQKFINGQVFKIQSYANISQRYLTYKSERAKIALDIDSEPEKVDKLIDFLTKNTSLNDKIFAFPWKPELYFLADRNNATAFDTPYMFFSTDYQNQMIKQLESNRPKYIIYNSNMSFGNMTINDLINVKTYILSHYRVINKFGDDEILVYGQN